MAFSCSGVKGEPAVLVPAQRGVCELGTQACEHWPQLIRGFVERGALSELVAFWVSANWWEASCRTDSAALPPWRCELASIQNFCILLVVRNQPNALALRIRTPQITKIHIPSSISIPFYLYGSLHFTLNLIYGLELRGTWKAAGEVLRDFPENTN